MIAGRSIPNSFILVYLITKNIIVTNKNLFKSKFFFFEKSISDRNSDTIRKSIKPLNTWISINLEWSKLKYECPINQSDEVPYKGCKKLFPQIKLLTSEFAI